MRIALYPGSFDPVTFGHLDVIRRAARIFDRLVVGVSNNPKKIPTFTLEERTDMIRRVCAEEGLANVEIGSYQCLLVDYAAEVGAEVIVRGLRAVADFEYEFQMALMNNKLDPEIETLFMMTSAQYSYLSSSAVKQVAKFGGNLDGLVPSEIIPIVREKINMK